MIWFAVIMLVVIALVVGPIMMMRPDPVQKNKENMRAIAFKKGIRFSVKNLPQQLTETEKPEPTSVYYFPPDKHDQDEDWLLLRTSYQHDIHFLGSWAWQGDVRATNAEQDVLKKYLPSLPDTVRAVSVGRQGVCVYWYEKGGEVVLEQIIALLENLKQLRPQPV